MKLLARVLVIGLMPFFLLITNTNIVFNHWFVNWQYAQANFPPAPTIRPDERQAVGLAALDFVRGNGGTVFHCTGTCRIGVDRDAVVDPALRVRGVEGLRVVDASVMPQVTSANSNAASLMIGERGARLILDRGRGGPPGRD